MKPSEYLINRKLISVGNFINPYKINYKLNKFDNTIKLSYIKELDKRFIDREKLKDKINEIDIWNKNGLKVKKEILELIDK